MLGNVADAADQRQPGGHRQQPHQQPHPARARRSEYSKSQRIAQQESAIPAQLTAQLGQRGCRAAGNPLPEALHDRAEALLDEGLAAEVAPDFAGEGCMADWERRRQRQVRVLGLLHIAVVLQVVGAVRPQCGRAQPGRHPVVDPPVAVQGAVRRVVHQDEQAQLACTDHHHRQWDQHRPGCTGPHGCADHAPAVRHQPQPAPGRTCTQVLPLRGGEVVQRVGSRGNGHVGVLLSVGCAEGLPPACPVPSWRQALGAQYDR